MIKSNIDDRKESDDDDNDNDIDTIGLENLFNREDDTNENDDVEYKLIKIDDNCQLYIKIPYDSIGTLFCDHIWNGSIILGQYIYRHQELYIHNKRIIEFGAATAIPSLISLLYCQCQVSVITDYPDPLLIETIEQTVQHNISLFNNNNDQEITHQNIEKNNDIDYVEKLKRRVCIMGYEWGKPIDTIQTNLQKLLKTCTIDNELVCHDNPNDNISNQKNDDVVQEMKDNNNNMNQYFDVVLLSECIWMHRCHEELLQSINEVLHPTNDGIIIMTYTHHIPGCEDADNHFFEIAFQKYHFQTIVHEIYPSPYMWDATKSVNIHLKVLQRNIPQNVDLKKS